MPQGQPAAQSARLRRVERKRGPAGRHLALRAVEPQIGQRRIAAAGEEHASRAPVGRGDLAPRCGLAVDADPGQSLAQLGLVLHPGGDLLTDIAALAEIDAMQALESGLKDEGVGRQLDPGFGDAVGHAQRVPVGAVISAGFAVKPPAEGRVARVGQGALGRGAGAAPHLQPGFRDIDLGAEAVHRQPLRQSRGQRAVDIQQNRPLRPGGKEEIGDILALRGQQGRIDQPLVQLADVVGDKALQELAGVGAGQAVDAARHRLCSISVGRRGACPWMAENIAIRDRFNRGRAKPMRAAITVLIPTLDAARALPGCCAALVEGLQAGLIRELIVSDGGSGDATAAIAAEVGAEVITGPASRGGQLARGAAAASGEWLLVHGAAGGVGLAAVDLGKHLGAKVIAAASSDEKLKVIQEKYAPDAVINSSDGFREKVKEITNGGADVIYDPVGGDVFDESVRCIAFDGRLLVVGFASGRIPEVKVNMPLIKGFSIVGVRAGEYGRQFPEKGRENMEAVWKLIEDKSVTPHAHGVYSLDDWRKAFAEMEERRVVGRVIIDPSL